MIVACFVCIAVLAWCLAVRWAAWRCCGCRAANASLAMLPPALVLASPIPTTATASFSGCRCWQVDGYLGHLLWLAASLCAIFHALSRITPDDRVLWRTFARAARPAVVAAPLLAVCVFWSDPPPATTIYAAHDGWMQAYWLTMGAVCVWLMGWWLWALSVVRTDPRSRPIADMQIAAAIGTAVASSLRLVDMFCATNLELAAWVLLCASVSIFAVSLAWSWRRKVAALAVRMPQREPAS